MPGELEASHLGARDPYVGRVLSGRFELRSRIGSGSMGHVYRAIDREDGSTCAIKVLRPELLSDWSLIKRFHREGRAAKAIDSKHVVRILDFGESDDVLYIAMEYLGGQTLAAWIEREGKAPPEVAIGVLLAIAEAIRAAHAAGVTHRDLKPENVVLGPGGGVKVVDFGIARIAEGSRAASEMAANVTIAGSLMGTPLYMSPEAAARRQVGPAADVYALGVIAYELLAGEPPFLHENPMHVIGMHLRVPPPRLRDTLPDVPAELDRLVHELMAKDPEDRPSADEVKRRVDAIALALGIKAAMPIDTLRDIEAPPPPVGAKDGDEDASTLVSPIDVHRTLEDPPRQRVSTGERFVSTVVVPPSRDRAARGRVIAITVALAVLVVVAVAAALRGEDPDPAAPTERDPRITATDTPTPRPTATDTDTVAATDTDTDTDTVAATGTDTDTNTVAATDTAADTATTDREPDAVTPSERRTSPRRPRRPPPRRPPPDEPTLDIARDYE